MQFFLLIFGLAIIIKSADVLIDTSSKIAVRYGVSTFFIGITVIAFGTSAPELSVGIISGITNTNQLTLGNIIGSALSNIALIVGLSATIMPLSIKGSIIRRKISILIGTQIVLVVMLFTDGILSHIDGVILTICFIGFMLYTIKTSKESNRIKKDSQDDNDTDADDNRLSHELADKERSENILKLWALSLLSLAGLFIGGKFTVSSSTQIAKSFGLSETLIGLTVVAIATTMPELITSIVSTVKREPEIVLGNCVGSNIFNILFVLGLSSIISPIKVEAALWIDVAIMIALTVFVFIILHVRKALKRKAGILLLSVYAAYLVYKIVSVLI